MNVRMAVGAVMMGGGFFVMIENVVYASRFGPAAWPVLAWTLPGAIVAALSGSVMHALGDVHGEGNPSESRNDDL